MIILFLLTGDGSAEDINSCTSISFPGFYRLNQNIIDSGANSCIYINSSNVILDGGGHTIDGIDIWPSYGINVQGSLTNVTVKNLTLTDWYDSIYYDNVMHGNITNIKVITDHYGIRLQSSSDILINRTNVSSYIGRAVGIYLINSDSNYITENKGNPRNISILLSNSDNNIITENTASNNDFGILLTESSGNILYKNDLVNNVLDNARNLGLNNQWDNGLDIGNHYSNYDESSEGCSDSNNNGICDATYTIPGSGGSIDRYPLTSSGVPVKTSIDKVIYFNTVSGTIEDLKAVNVADLPPAPPEVNLEYGLFSFKITGLPVGNSVTLTLVFPSNLPSDTKYWKYGPEPTNLIPHWYEITSSEVNGNKLMITLTDGGTGDDHFPADGEIIDDGGPSPITNISSCTGIYLPGVYVLNQSINSNGSTCILINSSHVVFDGAAHLITGAGLPNSTGVYVHNSSSTLTNVTVRNLNAANWDTAIIMVDSSNGTVSDNNASNNARGIYLAVSDHNTISGNNVSNNTQDGIKIMFSSNITISGNHASNHNDGAGSGTGINLYESNDNNLTGNNASNNYHGILLDFSSNNTVSGNNLSNNGDKGIYLFSSNNNMVSSNNASNSNSGIALSNSSNSTISGNKASNNLIGIGLDPSSNNNTIYNNYFNNTQNIYFAFGNSYNFWNTTKISGINIIGGSYIGGNFWANSYGGGFSQTCADDNHDGICDSPYVFNSDNIDYLPLAATPLGYAYISGTVLNEGNGISYANVTTNTSISTTSWASGFYSLQVPAGTYNLTATKEPVYYPNSSVMVTVISGTNVVQDIELLMKPTGNISGLVRRIWS